MKISHLNKKGSRLDRGGVYDKGGVDNYFIFER